MFTSRTRGGPVRYGGERCGCNPITGVGDAFTPAIIGERTCIDETHPGPPYKTGGPLTVRKKIVGIKRFPPCYSHYFKGLGWYDGYLSVNPYIPSTDPAPISLTGWGAIGWNRTFPLHPLYNLGASLIELKDVPGMISHTQHMFSSMRSFSFSKVSTTVGGFLRDVNKGAKFLGSNYLNLQFGWAPLLQDLMFLLNMQEKLLKKLLWLKRKNGKSIRRKIELNKYEFSEQIARTVASSATCSPTLSSNCYGAGMSVPRDYSITKKYSQRIWYVAKYRFWVPDLTKGLPLRNLTKLKAGLMGLSLDPSVIYTVWPWSWLLDWFTSVGSAIRNYTLAARYGVVAEYAYVMCKESYSYTAPGSVTVAQGQYVNNVWVGVDRTFTGNSLTRYEFRHREVANPYGFGITWNALSSFQLSILAALGLSKRPR